MYRPLGTTPRSRINVNRPQEIAPQPNINVPILQHVYALSTQQPSKNDGVRIPFQTVPDSEEPEWVESMRQNHKKAKIYSLPNELVTMILKMACPKDQFSARQSCSLFLRNAGDMDRPVFIKSEPKLAEYRLLSKNVFANSLVWPVPRLLLDRRLKGPRLVRIAESELSGYCDVCAARRKEDKLYGRLPLARWLRKKYCYDCGEKHPRVLFSNNEKPYIFGGRRRCIGREGYVRLCPHTTLSWDDILRFNTCAKPPRIVCTVGCSDPKDTLFGVQRTCLDFQVHVGQKPSDIRVVDTCTIRLFDLDPDIPIAREHLRRFFASPVADQLRQAMCPHVQPKDLMLMFEPGRCVCFKDPPIHRVVYGAHHDHNLNCSPDAEYQCLDECCRCSKSCGVFQSIENPQPGPEGFLGQSDDQTAFSRTHKYQCWVCGAYYNLVRNQERVYAICHNRMGNLPPNPADRRWVSRIAPESWGADQIEKRKQVLWCDDPGCRTRRLWTKCVPQK